MDDGLVVLACLFALGWWIVMGFVAGMVASSVHRAHMMAVSVGVKAVRESIWSGN
jgi:hypothetical protein